MRTLSSALALTFMLLNGTAALATDKNEEDWKVLGNAERPTVNLDVDFGKLSLEEIEELVRQADAKLANITKQHEDLNKEAEEKTNKEKALKAFLQEQDQLVELKTKLNGHYEKPDQAELEQLSAQELEQKINEIRASIRESQELLRKQEEDKKKQQLLQLFKQKQEEIARLEAELKEAERKAQEPSKPNEAQANIPVSTAQPQQPVGWVGSDHTNWKENPEKSDWINTRNATRAEVNKALKKIKKIF